MNFKKLFENQQLYYKTGESKTYQNRIKALIKLRTIIENNEDEIINALKQDLGKGSFESYLTEIGFVLKEINYFIKNLKKFMKSKKVKTPIFLFKAKSYLVFEPYGTVLILSPWNYPFQLSIMPLVGAIASGNTVVLKPSPNSVNTSNLLEKLVNNNFNEEFIKVINGSDLEADKLLDIPFDYIFFTGSTKIGKHVMNKASNNLTPVTLELGGKSPVIITDFKDLKLAAKRIAYGKLMNAGQTCIAPDYLLIKKENVDQFIEYFNLSVKEFYNVPLENDEYPKIINKRHHDRLLSYLDEGTIFGGKYSFNKIEPTIIKDINFNSKIMKEEIFGPILPIITYESLDQTIDHLKTLDKPLALYLFSDSKKDINKIINELSFGGATINDTLMHFANSHLPFGGVGLSGINKYHGKSSFKLFSHQKSVLKRGKIDFGFRYHPSTKGKENLIKKFLK